MTRVSVKVRMPMFSCDVFLPIHTVFAICFVCGLIGLAFDIAGLFIGAGMTGEILWLLLFFPLDCLFMFFAFKRPAKKMRELLETFLTYG